MNPKTQHLFCPVAMACEMLEPRWTMLVLCEMWSGSTRFNDIQRGVPAMSPSLLSKRLKDMETKGLVQRDTDPATGRHSYLTTELSNQLAPLVRQLGEWAHRNVEADVALTTADAKYLMWNIRRKIRSVNLPPRKSTIQFIIHNTPQPTTNYWLVNKPGADTDLCFTDPSFNVDLFLTCTLKALADAWMGKSTFEAEMSAGRITLIGNQAMAGSLTSWLKTSYFAASALQACAT